MERLFASISLSLGVHAAAFLGVWSGASCLSPPDHAAELSFAVEIVAPPPEPSVESAPPAIVEKPIEKPIGELPKRKALPRAAPSKEQPRSDAPAKPAAVNAPIETRTAHPAEYANNAAPEYPLVARRRGLQGKVTLIVSIDVHGGVTEVVIGQSSGHDVLDQAALRAVAGWRFVPASAMGVPVSSKASVPIEFKLSKAS